MPPQLRNAIIILCGVVLAVYIGNEITNVQDSGVFSLLPLLALIGLFILPWHLPLGLGIATITFASAFILPFVPGRPFVWEASVLLCWTGTVSYLTIKGHPPEMVPLVRRHKWLFVAIALYTADLLLIIKMRGAGLRVFGDDVVGGRVYFQQILCGIFPFAFLVLIPDRKQLVFWFSIQCLLSISYAVPEFIFAYAPGLIWNVVPFFDFSGDALFYAFQRQVGEMSRFASLVPVTQGLLLFLFLRYPLRSFLSPKGIVLIPVALGLVAVGLFSGHRLLLANLVPIFILLGYSERFFTPGRLVGAAAAFVLFLGTAYTLSDRLPESVQRALSFLPGLQISSSAGQDAEGTLNIRQELFREGLKLVPHYLWVGRGFSMTSDPHSLIVFPGESETLQAHIAAGRFYNGFLGLLINTGLLGLLAMLLFFAVGLRVAAANLRILRRLRRRDVFSRLAAIVTAVYCTSVLVFFFLHGDSDSAMKVFSFQTGILLIVAHHLRHQEAEERQEEEAVETAPEAFSASPGHSL